jgi:hypothetical protein
MRAYYAAWRAANPDKVRVAQAVYRAANLDKLRVESMLRSRRRRTAQAHDQLKAIFIDILEREV